MKLEIKQNKSTIELELAPLTQLCGVNFPKKDFIIQSIVKHFSGYKYKSYEEGLMNNVLWNGEVIGRKYFSMIHISNREDLIKMLSVAKMSIVFDYFSLTFSELDYQEDIEQLEGIWEKILGKLNLNMQADNIGLEFDFAEKSIFEAVQNGVVRDKSGNALEVLDNEELLDNFLHVLEAVQKVRPRKMLIVLENIDHLIDLQCYERFCENAVDIAEEQGLYFLVTTSIRKYVVLNRKLLSGIMVVNDEFFAFPEWEHLQDFMERNYPCQFKMSEDECYRHFKNIMQEIGLKDCEIDVRASVILKLINRVMGRNIGTAIFVNELEKKFILN